MDDQRCSLPQNKPTENRLSPKKNEGAPRMASFSTNSDIEQLKNKEKDSPKEVYNSTLLKNYIKFGMHEQWPNYCCFDSFNCIPPPQALTPAEQDYLFTLMYQSQRGQMDEQRCSLNISPVSLSITKLNQSTSFKG